jgi:hypothetical protein
MAKQSTANPTANALASSAGRSRNPPITAATAHGGQLSQPVGQLSGGGGGITVAHTRRQMKSYNFTESDLDTIGLANIVTATSFAVASGILTFCIDLNKDVLFAPNAPVAAQSLQWTVNWLGIPVAAAFIIVGIAAMIKRGSVITRVKSESENVPSE